MTQKISLSSRGARRAVRARRSRARIHGTAARPRLAVFRSHRHLVVQLMDDDLSRTLLGLTDVHLPKNAQGPAGLTVGVARAHALGRLLAERAGALGVAAIVFDKRGYAYHGQVKALAEGAREGGLKF